MVGRICGKKIGFKPGMKRERVMMMIGVRMITDDMTQLMIPVRKIWDR